MRFQSTKIDCFDAYDDYYRENCYNACQLYKQTGP